MYVATSTPDKIVKFDITTNPSTTIDIASIFFIPGGLAFDGTKLYISDIGGTKILRLDVSALSINDYNWREKVKIFPNSTSQILQIKGIDRCR